LLRDGRRRFAAANCEASPKDPARSADGGVRRAGPYAILFILTDQERFFRPGELPVGYNLPGHERLMKRGATFIILLRVHAIALGALHRTAHPTHADVRQHELSLDRQHVA
jgi:hypothetical protein